MARLVARESRIPAISCQMACPENCAFPSVQDPIKRLVGPVDFHVVSLVAYPASRPAIGGQISPASSCLRPKLKKFIERSIPNAAVTAAGGQASHDPGPVVLLASGQASANYYELLRRVPESANTIILIDVERMLMSPIAMKEKCRDKGYSEGVALHFPINAVRYMLASRLDFNSNFEDQGDIALIETAEGVSLP